MNSHSLQKGYYGQPKQINKQTPPWEGRQSNQLIVTEHGWVIFPSSIKEKDKKKYPLRVSDGYDRKVTFWLAKNPNQLYQSNYPTSLSENTDNKKNTPKWQHLL